MIPEQKQRWLTEQQLGTVQTLRHRGRSIQYRVPKEIENQVTLRFKGHGKTRNGEPGDLLLLLRVDRGRDVKADLWLSQTEARTGCKKYLLYNKKRIPVPVLADSRNFHIVCFVNAGKRLPYRWGLPIFGRKRGNLLVRLRVFEETIVPTYRNVDSLTTEDLSIEGWIYRRSDEVLAKIGGRPHALAPFTALDAANLFNHSGWLGIARALVQRLGLGSVSLRFKASPHLRTPGEWRLVKTNSSFGPAIRHTVTVRSEFLDDPFAVTGILAHELCHIIEARAYGRKPEHGQLSGTALMDMERTVDLLVFLFQLGEFQMRVARDRRMTLGYFNQELFERMYVILSRKRKAYNKTGP
jgi:hypothetical protein